MAPSLGPEGGNTSPEIQVVNSKGWREKLWGLGTRTDQVTDRGEFVG